MVVSGRKGRNETLIRALSLLRLLQQGKRHQLRDLAAKFRVSTRTIRRDFEALEAAGYLLARVDEPYEYGDDNGRWQLDQGKDAHL